MSSQTPNAPPTMRFNPQAAPFVPEESSRPPPKRKASSSAPGLSSKATPSSSGDVAPNAPVGSTDAVAPGARMTPSNQPHLAASDIFQASDPTIDEEAGVRIYRILERYGEPQDVAQRIEDYSEQEFAFATNLTVRSPSAFPPPPCIEREAREFLRPRTRNNQTANTQTPNPIGSIQLAGHDNINTAALLEHCADDARSNRRICAMLYHRAGTTNGRVRYLPLCPDPSSSREKLTVLPSHVHKNTRPLSGTTWPAGRVPVELFELITSHLTHDDIKSMRLVNRDFEQKVSRSLFHSSVVPFNTELYDMIDEDKKTEARPTSDPGLGGLQWQNAREDEDGKVYKGHGLQVFHGFGPYIRRFGMSFEVPESQLINPPLKQGLDEFMSYHGRYSWPPPQYTRFSNLAGLERSADESSRMKAAFANLTTTEELALCIDGGLGWLNGSDKSFRSLIFDLPSPVFRASGDAQALEAAEEFWIALQESVLAFGSGVDLKEINLDSIPLLQSRLAGLDGTDFADKSTWSFLNSSGLAHSLRSKVVSTGVLCGMPASDHFDGMYAPPSGSKATHTILIPNNLRSSQKEWLLETEWAQCAFLESYMLAVMDNPGNFHKIKKLNISKLSSRFVPMLARGSFWNALPNLEEVVLNIKPDWRTVAKDEAGIAETQLQDPSKAMYAVHRLLHDCIASRESVKRLSIGWVGGGEHAEGMFARNRHVLPSPITPLEYSITSTVEYLLEFPHVEELTLSNCWITPPALEELVKRHAGHSLKHLTLDSVSLTAHPAIPPDGQVFNFGPAATHQMAQAIVALHAQTANHAMTNQPGNGHVQWAQTMVTHVAAGGVAPTLSLAQLQNLNHFIAHLNTAAQIHSTPGQPHVPQPAFVAVPLPNQAPVPASTAPAAPTTNHQPPPTVNGLATPPWTRDHRTGSWPKVLNNISPGKILTDFNPAPSAWDPPRPSRRPTALRTLTLASCGYVRLRQCNNFAQHRLEPDLANVHNLTPFFRTRFDSLRPSMMEATDRYLGEVVQFMPALEAFALDMAWKLRVGWRDQRAAEAVAFDGALAGGTGRVSGEIEAEVVVGENEAVPSGAV